MRTHEEIRQDERQALKKLLLAMSQHRKMPRAEYFQKVTRDYELRLEYEQSTLFLALDIVGGKSFRRQVCDVGDHCLKNGLLAVEIFQAFKLTPDMCQVDLHRGVLAIKIKFMVGSREKIQRKEIEMNELKVCLGIKQDIRFGRVARECLKHLGGEDKEILLRQYQEKEKEYLKMIEDLRAQLRKPVPEPSIDPASLVMETPHRHRFRLQPNTITLQQGGSFYQVLLKKVLPKEGPFVLVANIISTKWGNIVIGVVDRRTQKEERSSVRSGNAVCYGGYYGYFGIHYANNGKHQYQRTGIGLKAGRELRVKVELDKGMATFTIDGKDFPVRSDILSDPNRQFVPYFEMQDKGDSVEWRME